MNADPSGAKKPVHVADQGFFFVGGELVETPYGRIPSGQMFVAYQIPEEVTQPYPLVLVHGGGGQGLDYLGTPDGRAGWASFFVRHGFAVYVVDRPGHGRSPYHSDALGPSTNPPSIEQAEAVFSAPETRASYPQAGLHSQWPGTGKQGDPALEQMLSGMGPMIADSVVTQKLAKRAGCALLERIGPAAMITHSMGGTFGWVVADERPDLVKALIAAEPVGPPFAKTPMIDLAYGLTSVPMHFEPQVNDPSEIAKVTREPDSADQIPVTLQASPPRRLVNLSKVPVAVVTAEASWMAQFDHGTVEFLLQSGVDAEHLQLGELGIHGNGHMMMMESNSDEVAAVLLAWLENKLPRQP